MTLSILTFFAGAGVLYLGAEGLVRGSINIARAFSIRPIVIGLSVVAFGTSAPEFVVSFISTYSGSSDIALGNVVGSNIANIGLILGIAAILRPIKVDMQSVIVYYPVLLISSIILFVIAFSGLITFGHGIFLFSGIIIFTLYLIKRAEKTPEYSPSIPLKTKLNIVNILLVVFGAIFLVIGSNLMVESGVTIARAMGVSEFTIGVTMIAVGTSLPELAATIVAVLKKQTGIILGNIIGSNIFNVLFVVGGVSLLLPIEVNADSLVFEFPVMILFSLVLIIMMRTGFVVNRVEGMLLLIGYIAFLLFLF